MDDFFNYERYQTFWWILYLEYAEWVCAHPEYSVRNGFSLGDYFKTRQGKAFLKKFERLAWAE